MHRNFTILVAEDSQDDAFLLERALRKNNIQNPLQIVPDGEEAVAYLEGTGKYQDRQRFPRPGFIILDLKMPRRSGLEVLEWIKTHPDFRVLPILMLSSSAQHQDIVTSYRLGANTFMVKPSSPQNLEHMVKVIHEYWEMAQRTDPPEVIK
jgi:CheY-like chemotaxis protein